MNSYFTSFKSSATVCGYGLIAAMALQFVLQNGESWVYSTISLIKSVPEVASSSSLSYIIFNALSVGYICAMLSVIFYDVKPKRSEKIFLYGISPFIIGLIYYTLISSTIPSDLSGLLLFLTKSVNLFILFSCVVFIIGYFISLIIKICFNNS